MAIVVNTGDDERFHGLHVSPDLDTMTYTLSGLYNPETGWGINGDSFETLQMLNRLGADTWFNLGSRDFAMHIRRTELLAQGSSLSRVTAQLTANLGIAHPIIPMSDQPVRTVLDTDDGTLSMQEYFVHRRAEPVVRSIEYVGASDAEPSPDFASALDAASTIIICPSNPFLSVAPILAVPGVRDAIASHTGPRIAELGSDVSAVGVAREYRGFCDVLVLDSQDANLADAVSAEGIDAAVMPTIMQTDDDKVQLAERVLALAADLENRRS
ncbi:2-phospho-L-lactate transferase [Geodia barretti]|uniref:2-phospho-L-lactate transferase n=1 Tax=Geodia barretti TaxID=519541 RepID=A0AA35WPN9_GEOBA|nr:2-phospho-L-lactate transferase [Geodia barretti]